GFWKNSFLPFLKRTSTALKGSMLAGSDIFESQSNTVSLLQPSVPQVPLFLHPLGWPPVLDAQLLQPIFLYIKPVLKERGTKIKQINESVKIPIFNYESRIQNSEFFEIPLTQPKVLKPLPWEWKPQRSLPL